MAQSLKIDKAYINKLVRNQPTMAKRRILAWYKLIQKNQSAPEADKLERVNRFFNLFQFRSDQSAIGKADYWMTPVEFMIAGGGDCLVSSYLATMEAIFNRSRIPSREGDTGIVFSRSDENPSNSNISSIHK